MENRWIVLFLMPCLAWAQFQADQELDNERESFSFLEQEAVASVPTHVEKSPNYCLQCGEELKAYQKKTTQVVKSLSKEVIEAPHLAEAPRSEKKRGGSSMRKIAPHTATQYSDRPRVTHRKSQQSSAKGIEKQTPKNEAQAQETTPSLKKQLPAAAAPRMAPQTKKEGMQPQTAPARPQRERLKPVQKNVVQSESKEISSLEGDQPQAAVRKSQKERLKSAGAEERKKRACAYKKKESLKRQFKGSISAEQD